MDLCDSCGKPASLTSCQLCGARLCPECILPTGICRSCAAGRRIE